VRLEEGRGERLTIIGLYIPSSLRISFCSIEEKTRYIDGMEALLLN
jgi:hypothetical protein